MAVGRMLAVARLSRRRCLSMTAGARVEVFRGLPLLFFFSSRSRHTRSLCDWSSDVCSSDLIQGHEETLAQAGHLPHGGLREFRVPGGGDPRGGGDGVHGPRRLERLDALGIVTDETAEPQTGYREELGERSCDPQFLVDHRCDADLRHEVGEGLIDDENGAGLLYARRRLEDFPLVESFTRGVVRVTEEHDGNPFEVS